MICSARSVRATDRIRFLQFADSVSWQRGKHLPAIRRRYRPARRDLRTGARSSRLVRIQRNVYGQRTRGFPPRLRADRPLKPGAHSTDLTN